jgi:hypothetical protein
LLQRSIQVDQLDGQSVNGQVRVPQRHCARTATALASVAAARVIHQHLSHRSPCRREEIRPTSAACISAVEQFQIRLVDQCGSLQRVPGRLTRQLTMRHCVQFPVEQWHNALDRSFTTAFYMGQQRSELGPEAGFRHSICIGEVLLDRPARGTPA